MHSLPLMVVAYAGYAVLKFFGYCLAALVFSKIYARSDLSAWKIGLARTLLGIVVGGLYTGAWALLESQGAFHDLPMSGGRGGSVLWYLGMLVPVRFFEWGLLLWFFFDRKWEQPGRDVLCILLGTLWSFTLDLPALLGLFFVVASIC